MSKKYKRRRKKRAVRRIHDNIHHLMWYRRDFEKNEFALFLRRNTTFEIPVDIHNEYHAECSHIPVPTGAEDMAKRFIIDKPEFTKVWMMCWYLISISTDKEFKNAMIEQYNFFAERNI